jgi:hypothetical protein
MGRGRPHPHPGSQDAGEEGQSQARRHSLRYGEMELPLPSLDRVRDPGMESYHVGTRFLTRPDRRLDTRPKISRGVVIRKFLRLSSDVLKILEEVATFRAILQMPIQLLHLRGGESPLEESGKQPRIWMLHHDLLVT